MIVCHIFHRKDIQIWQNEFKNMPTYAHAHFKTKKGEQIKIKVALSSVSMDGAYENMQTELKGWDFDKTAAEATEEATEA